MRVRFMVRRHRPLAALLMAAGLSFAPGCSDDGLPTRYPVSGNVTYKDKPVDMGLITFTPEAPDGRVATGNIEQGYYRLTTQAQNDGALPGKYRVTVVASEVDLTKAIAKQKGGTPHQQDIAQANRVAKRKVPEKYESPMMSGLTAEVKEQSNTFDFSLTD